MGKFSRGHSNMFGYSIDFELSSLDPTGKERTPTTDISGVFVAEGTPDNITGVTVQPVTNYIFDDAIEGFSGNME